MESVVYGDSTPGEVKGKIFERDLPDILDVIVR